MNNEDMSDIIQKFSNLINNSNNSEASDTYENSDMSSNSNQTSFNNIQDIISNMNINSNNDNKSNQENNNFNIDFETIMKIKSAMDKFNSCKNSPETNLLMSLKPYLNSNRKEKLDQYVQFLNIAKILENFNFNGEVNTK